MSTFAPPPAFEIRHKAMSLSSAEDGGVFREEKAAGTLTGVVPQIGLPPSGAGGMAVDAPSAIPNVQYDPVTSEDPASTQIDLPPEIAAQLVRLGNAIDDDHLADKGREKVPHITCKYGLLCTAGDVATAVHDFGPIHYHLGKFKVFAKKGKYDVLWADVISPELHQLNKILSRLPCIESDHDEYIPHATVAYLKSGLGEAYAAAWNGAIELVASGVATEITYSGPDRIPATVFLHTPVPVRSSGEMVREKAYHGHDGGPRQIWPPVGGGEEHGGGDEDEVAQHVTDEALRLLAGDDHSDYGPHMNSLRDFMLHLASAGDRGRQVLDQLADDPEFQQTVADHLNAHVREKGMGEAEGEVTPPAKPAKTPKMTKPAKMPKGKTAGTPAAVPPVPLVPTVSESAEPADTPAGPKPPKAAGRSASKPLVQPSPTADEIPDHVAKQILQTHQMLKRYSGQQVTREHVKEFENYLKGTTHEHLDHWHERLGSKRSNKSQKAERVAEHLLGQHATDVNTGPDSPPEVSPDHGEMFAAIRRNMEGGNHVRLSSSRGDVKPVRITHLEDTPDGTVAHDETGRKWTGEEIVKHGAIQIHAHHDAQRLANHDATRDMPTPPPTPEDLSARSVRPSYPPQKVAPGSPPIKIPGVVGMDDDGEGASGLWDKPTATFPGQSQEPPAKPTPAPTTDPAPTPTTAASADVPPLVNNDHLPGRLPDLLAPLHADINGGHYGGAVHGKIRNAVKEARDNGHQLHVVMPGDDGHTAHPVAALHGGVSSPQTHVTVGRGKDARLMSMEDIRSARGYFTAMPVETPARGQLDPVEPTAANTRTSTVVPPGERRPKNVRQPRAETPPASPPPAEPPAPPADEPASAPVDQAEVTPDVPPVEVGQGTSSQPSPGGSKTAAQHTLPYAGHQSQGGNYVARIRTAGGVEADLPNVNINPGEKYADTAKALAKTLGGQVVGLTAADNSRHWSADREKEEKQKEKGSTKAGSKAAPLDSTDRNTWPAKMARGAEELEKLGFQVERISPMGNRLFVRHGSRVAPLTVRDIDHSVAAGRLIYPHQQALDERDAVAKQLEDNGIGRLVTHHKSLGLYHVEKSDGGTEHLNRGEMQKAIQSGKIPTRGLPNTQDVRSAQTVLRGTTLGTLRAVLPATEKGGKPRFHVEGPDGTHHYPTLADLKHAKKFGSIPDTHGFEESGLGKVLDRNTDGTFHVQGEDGQHRLMTAAEMSQAVTDGELPRVERDDPPGDGGKTASEHADRWLQYEARRTGEDYATVAQRFGWLLRPLDSFSKRYGDNEDTWRRMFRAAGSARNNRQFEAALQEEFSDHPVNTGRRPENPKQVAEAVARNGLGRVERSNPDGTHLITHRGRARLMTTAQVHRALDDGRHPPARSLDPKPATPETVPSAVPPGPDADLIGRSLRDLKPGQGMTYRGHHAMRGEGDPDLVTVTDPEGRKSVHSLAEAVGHLSQVGGEPATPDSSAQPDAPPPLPPAVRPKVDRVGAKISASMAGKAKAQLAFKRASVWAGKHAKANAHKVAHRFGGDLKKAEQALHTLILHLARAAYVRGKDRSARGSVATDDGGRQFATVTRRKGLRFAPGGDPFDALFRLFR